MVILKHAIRFVLLFVLCLFSQTQEISPGSSENGHPDVRIIYQDMKSPTPTAFLHNSYLGVWMDSVMLNHTLRWHRQNNRSRYSVYYKVDYDSGKWASVPECMNITRTYCHMLENNFVSLLYAIKVIQEDKSINSRENTITFTAMFDTKLLPPKFKVSRHNDVLFIKPIRTKGLERVFDKIPSMKYQTKYWSGEDKQNETPQDEVSVISSKDNTVIVLKDVTIQNCCVSMRLYDKSYADHNYSTGSSDWSQPICLRSIEKFMEFTNDGIMTVRIIITSACIVFVLLAVVMSYKMWKIYKTINDVGKIPSFLIDLKTDLEQGYGWWNDPQLLLERENTGRNWPGEDYIPWNSNDYRMSVASTFYWTAGLKLAQQNEERSSEEIYPVWKDHFFHTSEMQIAELTMERLRTRNSSSYSSSSGYVSSEFSDAFSDNLDIDSVFHQQTTTTSSSHSTALHVEPCADGSYGSGVTEVTAPPHQLLNISGSNDADEYVADVSFASSYIFMHGSEITENDTIRIYNLQKPTDYDAASLRKHSPYENFTYCSGMFSDVPDVLRTQPYLPA